MKSLFELFPLAAFFTAYVLGDIFVATAVGMAASAVQVAWYRMRREKIPTAVWIGFAAFMIFGSLTLILRDKRFVMIKPTIVYGIIAMVLLFMQLALKKNPIKLAMQNFFEAPDAVWRRWLYIWIGFFVTFGCANLYVAQNFSEPVWVQFRVFGPITCSVLLTILQVWRMYPYMKQDTNPSS
jgi:intracellular septation protein